MKLRDCDQQILAGKKELKGLMCAAANGGRTSSMDGGRMGMYKLNDMRSIVNKSQLSQITQGGMEDLQL